MFMQGGTFSHLSNVRTQRLLLRRVTASDADDVFDISSDPRVARHVLWRTHNDRGDSRRFIKNIQRLYKQDSPAPWAIELVDEGRMIGTVGFIEVDRQNMCAEVGYSLGYAFWNRGYATEALTAVLDYGFVQLGFNRIDARHDVRNAASGRVMEKAGMQKEGILRQSIYSKGEYITVALYAALRSDPR